MPPARHCFIYWWDKCALKCMTFSLHPETVPGRLLPRGCPEINWNDDVPRKDDRRPACGSPASVYAGDYKRLKCNSCVQQADLEKLFNNYPIGYYVLTGPNSNTFAFNVFGTACIERQLEVPADDN